jgi:hypothetical protein
MRKSILFLMALAPAALLAQSLAPLNADGVPVGALAPSAIAKGPKAGFDITGTWLHGGGANNPFQFAPPANAKLKPPAQKEFDAYKKAQAQGKSYKDDIGQCWPAGLPVIMTRVWPIAMIQKPTVIYMVSGFMNELRIIYLDGRKHTDPDIVIPSFGGESIGHWEGDTLVVDTTAFVNDHHWIDNGIPASDELHIVERMKLTNNGATLEIAYTATDPKMWEGDWTWTKRWRRVDDQEITEATCLPNMNEHLPSTGGAQNVR